MNAPLYRTAREWLAANGAYRCPDQGHHGLWFERFYGGFAESDWSVPKPSKDGAEDVKRNWIGSVCPTNSVGDREALMAIASRNVELILTRGGDFRCLSTDWHFVTGLGLPHPIENGFAWHPTLGTPYLCGAAVKGLIRAYLEAWQDPIDHKKIGRWFGTENKSDVPEQAGSLVFFDALPIDPTKLGCDIMTPHMGKWYEQGGDQNPLHPDVTPGDWHSPVPVPFLVVEDATLLFGIAPRRHSMGDSAQAKADLDEALDQLVQALDWLGAGAKTAVGYGRMQRDEERENDLRRANQQQRARDNMTPTQRAIEDYAAKHPGNPASALLQGIRSGEFQNPETNLAAAEKVRELMQESGAWMPGFSGTNRRKLEKRDRSREVSALIEQYRQSTKQTKQTKEDPTP